MVNELKNITDSGVMIGESCNYIVSFWKGKKELLVLGVQLHFDQPGISFIRYSSSSYMKNSKDYFMAITLLAEHTMIFLLPF